MKPMWNNRNLRLLVLGQASSLVGNYTLKFALSMYILEVTGSAALFATFLSVAMVPTIVLSPFGGILADGGTGGGSWSPWTPARGWRCCWPP